MIGQKAFYASPIALPDHRGLTPIARWAARGTFFFDIGGRPQQHAVHDVMNRTPPSRRRPHIQPGHWRRRLISGDPQRPASASSTRASYAWASRRSSPTPSTSIVLEDAAQQRAGRRVVCAQRRASTFRRPSSPSGLIHCKPLIGQQRQDRGKGKGNRPGQGLC